MKFHDLAIGQRFELDGVVYVKTSPVLASREEGGERKFLARYVVVQPLDGAERRPADKAGDLLQAEAVLAAFTAYHARCREALERLEEVPADRLQEIANILEGERQGFLDAVLKG
ncbi:hypothetical protein [Sulfuricella sp.]|uniref:hypothetical protein n=1 Tax=Sulfuricella sp. TaxID=2099377 RepID=UPI002BAE531A|nr:hypothetical protein [Sulfuricella sp.]HUX64932.1 hypothetical protein [Sulfuricella sp.]